MTPEEIAKTKWNSGASRAQAQQDVAANVGSYLEGKSIAFVCSTSDLLRRLNIPVEYAREYVAVLAEARKAGMLDSYWTAGKPNRATYGKPSVIWHGMKETES